MRAADTNVLVRLFTRDDDRQAEIGDEFVSSGAWVSHVVLAETIWVLVKTYGRTDAEAAMHVQMLLEHNEVVLQDPDVVEAALAHYRRRPSLKFTDCLILEIARKAGHLPLGTFDRNLAKVDGAQRL